MPTRSFLAMLAFALLCPSSASWSQQTSPPFPEGPGKDIVVATCGGCHDINRARAGYTPAGWNMLQHMMQNMGAPIAPEDWPTVTTYLMKNFPERPRPAAVEVSGPAQATIRLWDVPTIGSRPHDPLATKDGAIWWTGQLSNKLGRVDPKTGAIREYLLKSAYTGPHGLTEDKDGNIWFTGNNTGLIGKLDPKTGLTTEYKLPDPKAKDPHTLLFDQEGILWFTVQQANMLGRLDPKTGDIKLVTSPTERSRPYGMAVNSKNVVHFVEFGVNKVATIDSKTMAIMEYPLPDPGARPRRIAIAPDDMIWYTDFARGFLGRLDPTTGKVTEWQSPSGPKSEPYGIVFTKGALWYNESFAKPNTIVRFDPTTEKFQTWAIPGGGDIVRNMDVTPDGNPVTANSLTNQVGLVEIK
ncbi:MAG: virginiamycin lyase [Alphaproteobacteria bacterium]|jgi:virginiamycin B lyase|nr:virginiamycin lyase [Alphaproteobacteria bacterium]